MLVPFSAQAALQTIAATPACAVWVCCGPTHFPGEGMGSGAVRDRRKGFIAPLSPHLPPGDRSIRVLIRHIRSPAFCIRMSSIEPGLGVRISAHWTGINPQSAVRYRRLRLRPDCPLTFACARKNCGTAPGRKSCPLMSRPLVTWDALIDGRKSRAARLGRCLA